jgi:hypothetical protein
MSQEAAGETIEVDQNEKNHGRTGDIEESMYL